MPRTVLVVDDDPTVLGVLADMLESLGCNVVTAEGGHEALNRLSTVPQIEILITDINMPGMDGHELAQRAKKARPELQILQLSGRERRIHGLPMIKKPFSLDDLAETMKRTTGLC